MKIKPTEQPAESDEKASVYGLLFDPEDGGDL
jgi:hypothetical protein